MTAVDGDMAVIRVVAEMGAPLTYRGPASALPCPEVCAPIVVRVAGPWPYRIAEVRGSTFASSADGQRARDGEPGFYGVVPWAIRQESPEFVRVEQRPIDVGL